MTIEPFIPDAVNRPIWETFIQSANNGCVFHRLAFLSYHPESRFESHHLGVYKRGRLFAVIPGVVVSDGASQAYVSHPGASYGGVVVPENLRFDDAVRLIEALNAYARSRRFSRIELTMPPTLYARSPDQTIEYALFRAGYGYRKRELTNIVFLDNAPETLHRRLPAKTRADIRQAVKEGLRTVWVDDPDDERLAMLHRMLLANRDELGLTAPPTHSLEELILLRERVPGLLLLGAGYDGDVPVSSALVFRCNPQTLLTFYICHERAARDRHPVHFLMDDLIHLGASQGYRLLDFGISSVNMTPLWSLIRFKESFRSRIFFRDTFEFHIT